MSASNANTEKMPERVFFCAISNISSGSCSEDCSFCTQSARFHARIETYREKPIEEIVHEAHAARKNLASGFCLVSSGKGITPSRLAFVTKAARAITAAEPELNIIACNGTATPEDLQRLKESGVGSYNHNLETSEAYYQKICTTHTWRERYETCLAVKASGLRLCSGGIFGMGESEKDRRDLVASLKSLRPDSIAINFFHPNPALPIKDNPLEIEEAFDIIRFVRSELPESRIMIAGGRERMFGSRQGEIFAAGADAIVVGNYLTTSGEAPRHDIEMVQSLGLRIARNCHDD